MALIIHYTNEKIMNSQSLKNLCLINTGWKKLQTPPNIEYY